MQGLADGYFIAPATVTAWLAGQVHPEVRHDHSACKEALACAQVRIDALRRPAGGGSPGQDPDLFRAPARWMACTGSGQLMIESCGIRRKPGSAGAGHWRRGAAAPALPDELRLADYGTPSSRSWGRPSARGFFGLADLTLRDAPAQEEPASATSAKNIRPAKGKPYGRHHSPTSPPGSTTRGPPRRHSEPLSFTSVQPERRDYR